MPCSTPSAAGRATGAPLPEATPAQASAQLDFLPPSRPAARFCDLLPPLPLPLFLPPLLDEFGELAMEAARCLLMPFLRRPSYCLSFLTDEPWFFAISHLLSSHGLGAGIPRKGGL